MATAVAGRRDLKVKSGVTSLEEIEAITNE